MDLKLAHLRTLHEVVRHGSFTRAAAARHLTQPAVSLPIRELEVRPGQPLLARSGRRVIATQAGTILLPHVARVLEELETAARELRSLQGVVGGAVRFGTGATASIHLLPPVLRELHACFPELELVVTTGNTVDIARAVAEGGLDFGLITLPVAERELAVQPVYTDPLVAIVPVGHALATARLLSPPMLAEQPLILFEQGGNIRRVIDDWFRRAGAAPRTVIEVGSAEATKRLVGAGLGLSLISHIAVAHEIETGELVGVRLRPALSRRLALVYRRGKPMSTALEAVLAAVARHLRTRTRLRAG